MVTSLSEFFFVPFIISKRLQNVIFREVNWRKLRPVSLKRCFVPFSSKHIPRVVSAGDGSTSSQWFVKAACSELCPLFSATPGPLALGRERKERLLGHPPLQPRFIASPAKRTPGQLAFGLDAHQFPPGTSLLLLVDFRQLRHFWSQFLLPGMATIELARLGWEIVGTMVSITSNTWGIENIFKCHMFACNCCALGNSVEFSEWK